jgi:hypothetical protein
VEPAVTPLRAEAFDDLRSLAEIEARFDPAGRSVAWWADFLRADLVRVAEAEDAVEERYFGKGDAT